MAENSAPADRRKQTRASIYHCLYHAKGVSTNASLSRELNLSLPTIYQNLSELTEAGLVRCDGEARSTGGRRAKSLAVVSDARIAVGISVIKDRIRLVLTDLYLEELAFREVPNDLLLRSGEFAVFLAQELERFLDDFGADRGRLLGVGIAFPGVVSPDGTGVLYAPTLGLRNIDPGELVQRIPYPVFWENDATCGGRAEVFVRGGRSNMAYLSLETGVGGAVLTGGAAYVGDHRRSGEFGHMCVEPAGLPCNCGKRGCLEAYCSAQRIINTFGVSLDEFFLGLKNHVPEYEVLWHDLLRHLAIGVNNIRMALDCDVVLGGFLAERLPPYMPQLQEYAAANNTFEQNADYIQLSVLRRHALPLGAALYFVQAFLEEV